MAAGAVELPEQVEGGLKAREKLTNVHQVVRDAGQGVPVVPCQGQWRNLLVSLGEGRLSTREVPLQAPGGGLGIELKTRWHRFGSSEGVFHLVKSI